MSPIGREQLVADEVKRLKEHFKGRNSLIVNYDVNDVLPNPTPLTVDLMSHLLTREGAYGKGVKQMGGLYAHSIRNDSMLAMFMGRAYLDMGLFFKSLFGWLPLFVDTQELIDKPEKVYNPDLKMKIWAWPLFILMFPYYLWAVIRFMLLMARRKKTLMDRFFSDLQPRIHKQVNDELALDIESMNDEELVEAAHRMRKSINENFLPHQWTDIISFVLMTILKTRLKTLYGGDAESRLNGLLQGYDPRNPVTKCGKDLESLARNRISMDEFLKEHGNRASPDAELSAPRWRENPEEVMKIVGALKEGLTGPGTPLQTTAQLTPEEIFPVPENIWKWVLKLFPNWRNQYVNELKTLKSILAIREVGKLDALRMMEPLRRVVIELGSRKGIGDYDIFFLKFDELRELTVGRNMQGLINHRKELRDLMLKIEAPPFISSEWLDMPYTEWPVMKQSELVETGEDRITELKGYGVSPGIAKGKARVITELSQGKSMQEGEILVVSWTDPSWTAIFYKASGVVTEAGGILSHGVVVARELGLPAVSALKDATRYIKTGDLVTVDGEKGTVSIEKPF